MATTITAAIFRQNFPEFADVTRYPNAQVDFWLGYADKLLYDVCRWSDMRDYGIQLVVAHQLTLWRRSMDAAGAGGTPGGTAGAASSKAVGGVSVSYDTGAALLENGGYWNLTVYGIQFWQLALIVGLGGFQLY